MGISAVAGGCVWPWSLARKSKNKTTIHEFKKKLEAAQEAAAQEVSEKVFSVDGYLPWSRGNTRGLGQLVAFQVVGVWPAITSSFGHQTLVSAAGGYINQSAVTSSFV